MIREAALLLAAGLVAGAMNAVAGGGSFVSLPALIGAGLPAITANASSTVALFPGSLAATWALRAGLSAMQGVSLRLMATASVAGGLLGAILLLETPEGAFAAAVPWLLLFGACAFAAGRRVGPALRRVVALGPRALLVCQFVLGLYGGYFGGAAGILMLATWTLFGAQDLGRQDLGRQDLGRQDLGRMNATRVALVMAANASAVLCFLAAGRVAWPEVPIVAGAAVPGSYGGAKLAQRAPPAILRGCIIALSAAMTATLFVHAYG